MSVVSAGAACELRLNGLIVRALRHGGGVTAGSAQKLAKEISNKELTAMLSFFYNLPDGAVARIQKAFVMRNAILHGGQKRQVPGDSAREAVRAARELAAATLKGQH